MKTSFEFCAKPKYDQGYTVQDHIHPCYEIVYYLEGEGSTKINNKTYRFKPGTLSIVKPNTVHSETAEEGSRVMFVGFTTQANDLKEGIIEDATAIHPILEEIEKEKAKKDAFYKRVLDLLTEEIVIYILRNQQENIVVDNDSFENVLNYIRMNANKCISVREISTALGYSYDYFRQMFSKRMGVSAKQYLMDIKLTNIEELLENTDKTVCQIANITGFSSTSAMCSFFKGAVGVSPKEYRLDARKQNYSDNQAVQSK